VGYTLIDCELHFGADSYAAVICAMPDEDSSTALRRYCASQNLVSDGLDISLSGLGAHTAFEMALRPEFISGMQVLRLRSTIHLCTKTYDVNFVDIQLAYLGLSPADSCEHSRKRPLRTEHESVIATSVLSLVPANATAIGITLTHFNEDAQFLCCTKESEALYQGDCCIVCALNQAREKRIRCIRALHLLGEETSTMPPYSVDP